MAQGTWNREIVDSWSDDVGTCEWALLGSSLGDQISPSGGGGAGRVKGGGLRGGSAVDIRCL